MVPFPQHLATHAIDELHDRRGLQAFASERGADFYGVPRNTETLTLAREPWTPPATYGFGEHELVPFRAGETIAWRMIEVAAS